ncbi:MAG: DNA topoisomerase IB [Microlunatus sp.]|nr:DNA topoisomerase IB [Microlunatus sp.]
MRLRRSDTSEPGLRRRRRGSGFSYSTPDGSAPARLDVQRIRQLAIPPAWRDVWICPYPNGHIQAFGIDDAGRRQYIYHDEWRRRRDEEKYDRVLELAPELPRIRRTVERQLSGRGWSRLRTAAVALRMLDHGVFRTGGEEYAEQNGTYGVATLLRSHVQVRGARISFAYIAKGGVDRTLALDDPPLARAITRLKRLGSQTDRLLVYREHGRLKPLHPDDVNLRFKELAGDQFSAKDLRTWNATVLAATALAAGAPPRSTRTARRTEAAALREVAEHLGNTPAVARKSYVDPRLFDLYEHGTTIEPSLIRIGSRGELADAGVRRAVEQAVLRLLTE